MLKRLAASLRGIVSAVDLDARDAVLGLGLVLLGGGLAMVWVPAAMIVPGGILAYVAIFGATSGAE